MKKTNAVLAVLLLVIATMVLLVACGEKQNPGTTDPTQEQLSQNSPATEATTQPTQGAPTEESKPDHSGAAENPGGTYTIKVEAQLGTGERPTVYTGTITV